MSRIALSDLTETDIKYKLSFCIKDVSTTTYTNLFRFLKIAKTLDFDWQPKIEELNKYKSNHRFCINTIGFGKHGFAMFSNNGKIIKITDDISEINYLFLWNYATCCSEDKLMVPIHKFHLDQFGESLHILWKDYADDINENNPVTEDMMDRFFIRLARRSKFMTTMDFGITETYAKNLGTYNGDVVFYDSGYHRSKLNQEEYVIAYKVLKKFEERVNVVTDIEEVRDEMRKVCRNKKGIDW